MPEYSSTTITPADSVKVPAMNGSTSGNFQLDALKSFILASKGAANGLASLDSSGKLAAAQIPDSLDDVIVATSYATLPNPGTAGKLYITADTNEMYRWDDSLATPDYVVLSVDLSAYATKAEMEAADTNLKNAIQSNTARIENLEQEHGGLVITQYRGTNLVPSGKAKYAMVETLVGKSRPINNLTPISTASTQTVNDVTFTNNGDGSWTVSGTASADTIFNLDNLPAIPSGHEILFVYGITTVSGKFRIGDFNNGNSLEYGVLAKKYTASGAGIYMGIQVFSGTVINITFTPFVRDLSLMYPEFTSVQLASKTIAELVAIIPDLLVYQNLFANGGNGYSLVDTTVEGVESISRNRLNPTTFKTNLISWGGTDNGDGTVTIQASDIYVHTIWENKTTSDIVSVYFGGSGTLNAIIRYTDDSFDYLTINAWTTSNGSKRVKAIDGAWISGATTLDVGSCGILTGSTSTWSDYFESTLSLPSPVTLRSAVTVAEVYTLDTGKVTHPVGRYAFTGSETWTFRQTVGSLDFYRCEEVLTDVAPSSCTDVVLSNNWYGGNGYSGSDPYLMIISSDTLFITIPTGQNPFTYFTSDVVMHYELATPDADTDLGVVIDNTIATEGGGTINTIQTQDVEIDNCMDVAYLAL